MKNRNLWRMIFTLSAMVTLIGLGFTAYNSFCLSSTFYESDDKMACFRPFFPKSCHGCD